MLRDLKLSPPHTHTTKPYFTSVLDPILNMGSDQRTPSDSPMYIAQLLVGGGRHMYSLFDLTAPFLCTQNGNNSAQ